jgi:hypothetical protein
VEGSRAKSVCLLDEINIPSITRGDHPLNLVNPLNEWSYDALFSYRRTMMSSHENSDFHNPLSSSKPTQSVKPFFFLNFGFYFRSRSFPRAICGSSMPQPQEALIYKGSMSQS